MITAGDEFGRTQHGNNNAYCQDNEVSWVDWQGRSVEDQRLTRFVSQLLELRRKHPVFRRSKFLTGRPVGQTGIKDVMWLTPAGVEMGDADWTSPSQPLGAMIFAARQPTTTSVDDDLFLIILNADASEMAFLLPQPRLHGRWQVVLDTARPEIAEGDSLHSPSSPYMLCPRSFVLLHDA